MDGTAELVDEDRPRDADLVAQAAGRSELLVKAAMRCQMLAWMGLAGVDEVPVPLGMVRYQLVEQRTLCAAVGSGEGAELEHDAASLPELGEARARAVESGQVAVGRPLACVQRVRELPELLRIQTGLDVRVELLVVVRAHRQTLRSPASRCGDHLRDRWRHALPTACPVPAPLLLRSLRVAALVGTVLVAINQLDIVAHGNHGPSVIVKIGLTYAVPFCVATFAALATIREPRRDRCCGA